MKAQTSRWQAENADATPVGRTWPPALENTGTAEVSTGTLERIGWLTDALRTWYRHRYDGPGSENEYVLEMREELRELLAPGASVYEQERALHRVMGWRWPPA